MNQTERKIRIAQAETTLWTNVFGNRILRPQWQSYVDGAWFPCCEPTSETTIAHDAQGRWQALGYNTRIV
jgi:hypothetical protein